MYYSAYIEIARSRRMARTYFGSRLEVDLEDSLGYRVFFFGVWEPTISFAIQRILRPGDTFVDVGANIGYDTLLGAKAVGPTGHVVAIEASPRIVQNLIRNVDLNRETCVRIVNEAVSDRPGTMQLYGGDPTNVGNTSTLPRDGLVFQDEVKAQSLDALLTLEERQKVRLIKIDVEGGEAPILLRLANTLDEYNPELSVIVETTPHEGGSLLVEAFNAMISKGFRAFSLENAYDVLAYIPANPVWPPVEVKELPSCQADILFTRQLP